MAVAEGIGVATSSLSLTAQSRAIVPAPPQFAGSVTCGFTTVLGWVLIVQAVAASMACAVVNENVMAALASPEFATDVVKEGVPMPHPSTVGASSPER